MISAARRSPRRRLARNPLRLSLFLGLLTALLAGFLPGGIANPGAAAAATCPCSIWSSTSTPVSAADPDTSAVELGVKFRSDVAGQITGIRFYKGSGNTGTHVGHLWTSSGTSLGSVTFTR